MAKLTQMMTNSWALALLAAALTACGGVGYHDRSFGDLPAWSAQRSAETEELSTAMARSCTVYEKRADNNHRLVHPKRPRFGSYQDWQPFCQALLEHPERISSLIETHLKPIELVGPNEGMFTGYYEPELKGSFQRDDVYNTPIFKRPDNLVTAKLEDFYSNIPDDMTRRDLVGRLEGQRFIPYHNRAEIIAGALAEGSELLWVDNPIDAFFLQIQGSGRVRLPNGEIIYVGYAGKNGKPYTAIGRVLLDEGKLSEDNVSLSTIRDWLENNPEEQNRILNANESFVFFTEREDGPYGAQGVLLTPHRSLAVDTQFIPLGVPVYVSTKLTGDNHKSFDRLMVAQDIGGAIKGKVRGDIFFGHSEEAKHLAGWQQEPGRLFAFVPKTVSLD